MKNTKKCPKCQSSDIVKIKGYWNFSQYNKPNNAIPASYGKTPVLVNRYLCRSCGFSEEWINQGDIKNFVEGKNSFDRYSKEFHDEQPTTHSLWFFILRMIIPILIMLSLIYLAILLKHFHF